MSVYTHSVIWDVLGGGRYTIKLPSGNFIEADIADDLNIGDSIKLDTDDLTYEGTARSSFTRQNDLGTAKRVIEDYVIVEIGSITQKVWNPNDLSIKPGDAVEIGQADNIIAVHPDVDLSLSLFGPDNDSIISSFKEDTEDDDDSDTISFENFGGITTQQNQFRERVELFLRESEKLTNIGTEPRMGALFHGPPGTGKTHFARILSKSLEAQFYRIRGPEIISKGVGDTERLIREIFDDAQEESPSIIFFDEIDSIAVDRGGGETRDFSQRIVAQLLSVIDGFDGAQENVFIIAATNQIDEIDKALLRPGRFDWLVHFPEPEKENRMNIFETLREDYQIPNSVSEKNVDQVMNRTTGWTGADLRALLNEAGILAVGADRDEIRIADLLKAHERLTEQENNDRGA
ncbi:ATP-binding protein [Haladaptatus sp. CMAA 1911]|uniref:ATP-binding protein n=1 Tax=unclassified Haladaptatus TaxID=2622732 RepID=UPI003754FF46